MRFLIKNILELALFILFVLSVFFCSFPDAIASCGSDGCGHADHLRKPYHD